MQPILLGALLALTAHQTEATWGPNTWWGWNPSNTATVTTKTTSAPAANNWGWNWGSNWGPWGVKPAGANLWGSCPQGQWQWRTGCRAIPECAPGQAWKGWASGCCKNDCPINQTWDPRTGRCCAVPTCPAGQGWKGWARGCCADNPASVSRPATKPAPAPARNVVISQPAPAPASAPEPVTNLVGDDVEVVDLVDGAAAPVNAPAPPAVVRPAPLPASDSVSAPRPAQVPVGLAPSPAAAPADIDNFDVVDGVAVVDEDLPTDA